MAQARSMQPINQQEKTRIHNLQHGPRKQGKQDIYYTSEVNQVRGKEKESTIANSTEEYGPQN